MAGFGILGMPMGNDKSAAANKARKDALARIALLKKKEMDTATYIAGEVAKLLLPDPATLKRAVGDPSGTLRGAAEIASLTNPSSYIARASNLIQGKGLSLYGANMEDVNQAVEIAGLIPTGKAATVPLKFIEKGASVASKGLLKGVERTAARTSADSLNAASGGLLRGSPIKAARSAPEPSEFDKIINAAKAQDPTLGNVVPAGVQPPVFRSELDWDESMSVNYDKARKKITMDLLSRQKGAAGEDPTLINPLIDDSIAALDDEIGNLSMRNYNHNDLEDFLGKIAAPDDYIVADSTLAKRADDFINEVDTESVLWGADPEAWLLDTQFGMDAAKSGAKGVDEVVNAGANAVTPMRPASLLPRLKKYETDRTNQQAIPGRYAEEVPDISGKTDNEKVKTIREFLNPNTKKINVNTGEVGSVVGQADLEIKYSDLVLRGRLSKRSRDYGKPYDFNPQSRANTIIVNREKEIGKQLSVENKTRIKQEEINRNTSQLKELIEAAAVNFKDEYDEAYNLGGIPAVLDRFEVAHIGTLTSGARVEWSNVRLVPKEIHAVQGTKPWANMYTLLVKKEEETLGRKLTAAEKAVIKKKITLIR